MSSGVWRPGGTSSRPIYRESRITSYRWGVRGGSGEDVGLWWGDVIRIGQTVQRLQFSPKTQEPQQIRNNRRWCRPSAFRSDLQKTDCQWPLRRHTESLVVVVTRMQHEVVWNRSPQHLFGFSFFVLPRCVCVCVWMPKRFSWTGIE